VTAPPARPRIKPRWVFPAEPDPAAVQELAAELHLPPLVCRLLLVRGYSSIEPVKEFLRPRLERLHSPHGLPDAAVAVERLERAARNAETVLVHGDYDVDGICATTLLTRSLRYFGAKAVPFIPRRLEDGYDLSEAGVRAAREAGARLVVTCDCGTSALKPIRALCESGIDVIVTDHHLPGGPLPECLAVLNPKRSGSEYPDRDLAAVGVAFKLMLALAEKLGANANFVYNMLDLVALATIADVAPLRGENRIFARDGLRLMAETPHQGLRALMRASGVDGRPLTAGRVGFILAPRLNAAGRIGHAMQGVELLLSESEPQANRIARELEEMNRRRQEIDRATLEQARRRVDALDLDNTYGIVLAEQGWHPGVIGIVASRIVEETARPTVLISLDGNEGKGSGRAPAPFDLHAGLSECRDLLVRFGGHRAAAGVTIDAARVEAFAHRFNEVARAKLSPDDLQPELKIDAEISIDEVTDELESLLRHFEPFGVGNPTPVFLSRGVRLAAPPRVVGTDGLKLRVAGSTHDRDALGWGMGELAPELPLDQPLDLAYRIERDTYQGESRLQLRIADLRPSGGAPAVVSR
jgi:single-stranded-DNA-specific exonuclease